MSQESVLSVTGYVIEVGALHLGLQGARPTRGATLECGERDMTISGLDEDECRQLAKLIQQEVAVRITLVAKQL